MPPNDKLAEATEEVRSAIDGLSDAINKADEALEQFELELSIAEAEDDGMIDDGEEVDYDPDF